MQTQDHPIGIEPRELLIKSGALADYVLTPRDAAARLSISIRTLWRLIEAEKIRAIQLSTQRRGILASELARFLDEAAA